MDSLCRHLSLKKKTNRNTIEKTRHTCTSRFINAELSTSADKGTNTLTWTKTHTNQTFRLQQAVTKKTLLRFTQDQISSCFCKLLEGLMQACKFALGLFPLHVCIKAWHISHKLAKDGCELGKLVASLLMYLLSCHSTILLKVWWLGCKLTTAPLDRAVSTAC